MNIRLTTLTAALCWGYASGTHAHVSFATNSATAGKSFIATANIPHGCTVGSGDSAQSYDTYKVVLELPTGVTARPMHSSLGKVRIESSLTSSQLIWEKPIDEAEPSDTHLYQLEFRFSVPNAPLTTLEFKTTQYCSDGVTEVGTKVWEGVDVPKLKIVPPRSAGWNKYTAQTDIDANTVSSYFADAIIVWSGGNAYSSNPVTSELISNPLSTIPIGTDYWVKY